MAEHYTLSTLEDTAWCSTCKRSTQHHVSARRLAHCLEHGPRVDANGHNKKTAAKLAARETARQTPTLFGDR